MKIYLSGKIKVGDRVASNDVEGVVREIIYQDKPIEAVVIDDDGNDTTIDLKLLLIVIEIKKLIDIFKVLIPLIKGILKKK